MESSMKKPMISVCVVTYNHEDYIRQCLQSIVDQQTDCQMEVIVGEDCSTDGTRAIVQEFAQRYPGVVKPLLHERNVGAYCNYKSVHDMATGDLIAHCDGDDYWLPGKVQAQVEFMMRHPECNITGHKAFQLSDSGQISPSVIEDMPALSTVSAFYRHGNFLNHSSTMYRAGCRIPAGLEEGGGLDFLFHIWRAGDGAIGFQNEHYAVYRQHGASMMNSYYSSLFYFNLNLAALAEIHKTVGRSDEFEASKFKLCMDYMKNFIANGRADLARQVAADAHRFMASKTHRLFLNFIAALDSLVFVAVRAKRKYLW